MYTLLLERPQSKPPVEAVLVVTYLQFPIQVCFPCSACPSTTPSVAVTDTFLNSLVVLIVVLIMNDIIETLVVFQFTAAERETATNKSSQYTLQHICVTRGRDYGSSSVSLSE